MDDYNPVIRVDYTKLRKIIKRKGMTISAFGKRSGMSRADLYMMQIDEMMSIEGEYQACFYLNCDVSDIRDIYPIDPDHPDFK